MYSIYRIKNEVNGDSYIGYTIQSPAEKRFARHVSSARGKGNSHLHRAMRKYGIDNFSFEVLCWGEDHEAGLEIAEPLMIELFPHEYNMTKGGEGSLGRTHTEATKEKLRIASSRYVWPQARRDRRSVEMKGIPRGPYPPERGRRISEAKMGKPQTPSHRAAAAKARLGLKATPLALEHLREAAKKRPRKNGRFI